MAFTRLSVNVNAIAQLRNRRNLPWPSVTGLSAIALEAGAYGITVHPRPDERHIRRTDVYEIDAMLRRDWPGKEYNIEGYPTDDFLALCESVRPDQVTLVPDLPGQNTSDHGWDTVAHKDFLTDVVARIHGFGARVSIFVDADPKLVDAAKSTGAERIEIYTGPYGGSFEQTVRQMRLEEVVATAKAAFAAGIDVNIGHDLTLKNLPPLLYRVPQVAEASIGHAVIADALLYGLGETVRKYRTACGETL
ncbi:pyridoxine 5'-phosphate synthase [Oryzibacter oryziterrae]|uniref:pyridoxine 5'-phosphate synthase n=1 Tax=Oryzibacter oryziterrae TaxID=2766474 RepID=UPI001F00F08C|nr:pyridoxine 5'-phosphate synthase [Oryzibacter oryziterrae]